MKHVILFAALFLLCLFPFFHIYAQLTEPFVQEEIGENWNTPVQIEFDERGRGYITERRGLVWILSEDGERLSEPLIDIREEVVFFGDHGLLSIALHPNFLENGYIYLLYVVDRHHLLYYGTPDYDPEKTVAEQATIGRITRYTADQTTDFTTIIPGSRKVLLGDTPGNGFPILMVSHGVGSLAFGSDGTLLASCGDGGSFQTDDMGSAPETYYAQALEDGILRPKENIGSFRAQLIDCLNGKILRLDAETGDGVPSNPFYDPEDPRSARSRMWALGFRQPYRFIVKPGTGSHYAEEGNPGILVVGDVGASFFEEINVVTRGGMNFGWPMYEGLENKWPFSHADLVNPDAPNPLVDGSCEQPFFKFIELVKQPMIPDPDFYNPCAVGVPIPDNVPHFIHSVPAIAWSNEKYNQPTRAMVAHFDENGILDPITIEDPQSGVAGLNFEGSSSIPGCFYGGSQFPETYHGDLLVCDFSGWIRVLDMDDSNRITSVDTLHTDVEFIVDLTCNPTDGMIYYVNLFHRIYRIKYGGNVPPRAVIETDRTFGPAPLNVDFDGSFSSDANQDPLAFHWDFGDGTTSDDVSPQHTFPAPTGDDLSYTVLLTVTDTAGAQATASVVISPDNTPPLVEIVSPRDSLLYSIGGTNYIALEAEVSDPETPRDALQYQWQWFLHHNDHFHPEFPVEDQSAIAPITPAGCNGEEYYYRVRLEVADPQGLRNSDEVFIYPYCGEPIFSALELDGEIASTGIDLHWQIQAADVPEAFAVQRGLQYEHLETLAIVDGSTIAFTDPNPPKGVVVYRIKAIRDDQVYDYSNLAEFTYPPPPRFRTQPNPVKNELGIQMRFTESDFLTMRIYDPSGKLLKTEYWWHSQTETRFSKTVDVSTLIPGIYFYILEDGNQRFDGSFIIAR